MFYKKLFNIKNIDIEFCKSLKDLLSFRPNNSYCFCYINCKTEKSLKNTLKILKKYQKKYIFLGNGSNTIFQNNYFDGFILHFSKNKIKIKNNLLQISSDINLFKLHKILIANNLGGLEWAFGIPASLGGAVFMNAGAFGHEMCEFVKRVKVLKNGKIFWTKIFDFAYRYSSFQKSNDIILEVVLNLTYKNAEDIKAKQNEYFLKRKATQPIEFCSAGSVFKRNNEIIPAKIIDNLALKGKSVGGAEVSGKHAGFIINKNNATCEDFFLLASEIKKFVKEKTNIDLQFEVNFVK